MIIVDTGAGIGDAVLEFVAASSEVLLVATPEPTSITCLLYTSNVVLGVLAKAAPQMNMFVVGIQIKVLVGLILLLILVQTIPSVSDFIFSEMRDVITQVIHGFQP